MTQSGTQGAPVFSSRRRMLVWFVVGLSTIGTLVAILVGSRLRQTQPRTRDSFTAGPLGHRAFLETLDELGVRVVRERRGLYSEVRSPLLFLEPGGTEVTVDGETVELAEIVNARGDAERATIVVLPKWRWPMGEAIGSAEPDPDASLVLEAVLPGAMLRNSGEISDTMQIARASGPLGDYSVALPWTQVVDSPVDETLLAVEAGALVIRRDDGLIVVTDPDLLHSWNVQREDHAQIFEDLFEVHLDADTVVLDEVFHGHGLRLSLGAALGGWPTVLFTAHVLFVLALLVMIGASRFGRPLARRALGLGPAESIAVSAFVLSEGRPVAALAETYVRGSIADLAERLGSPPGKDPRTHAEHIDRVAKRRGVSPRALQLLEQSRQAETKKKGAKQILAIAQAAHALRAELLN